MRHLRDVIGRGVRGHLGGRRRFPGPITTRATYKNLILRLLLRADGHLLPSREIRSTIGRRLANRLTETDLSRLRGGELRWVINMQWTRKRMVMDGLLEQTLSSGHGVWKLTREGVREAEALVG